MIIRTEVGSSDKYIAYVESRPSTWFWVIVDENGNECVYGNSNERIFAFSNAIKHLAIMTSLSNLYIEDYAVLAIFIDTSNFPTEYKSLYIDFDEEYDRFKSNIDKDDILDDDIPF